MSAFEWGATPPGVVVQSAPVFSVGDVESGGVYNSAMAVESLRFLLTPAIEFDSEALVEVTFVPPYGSPVHIHHRAADVEKIVSDVNLVGRHASAVRITVNPLHSKLAGPIATADDVSHVCWFAVNVNGRRGPWNGRCADHREREHCVQLANDIRLTLRCWHAWPEPVVINTGNGMNHLFRISLSPREAAEVVPAVLASIHDRFNKQPGAIVDYRSTSRNDFRLRMPCTLNRKSDVSTLNRPQMPCRIDQIRTPEVVEVVPRGLLVKAMDRNWEDVRPERKPDVAPWANASAWMSATRQNGGAQ